MLCHEDQLFESRARCPAGYRFDEKHNCSRVTVLVVGGGPDGHDPQPLGRFGFVSGKNYDSVIVLKQFREPPEVLDLPRARRVENVSINGLLQCRYVCRVNRPRFHD